MRVNESAIESLGLGQEDAESLIISAYDAAEQVNDVVATM
jgi:hypothetical protein